MAELKQAQSTFERRNQLFQDNLISEEEQGQITLDLAVAKERLFKRLLPWNARKRG
jgi:multidrug resistance efflux pump